MRRFTVDFRKVVSDDTGHERCVLQWTCVVRGFSEAQAIREAKLMLCHSLGVADWRVRADSCQAREIADKVA
ncbi:hypothetical protein M446_0083 [Methylobacterium sp. 4-46]|uniref:hypothetical protein n=1 Tax=unclassified Methylobacterium TaxID=2615210 RepID=UPI000152DA40|nr:MULTISPECIES: hypothetical protein [Methylobacterium]ACA14668.1 hypothetical protein M446_0083 [Methylobacterium sp. 4-46]WFT80422.1 hypothetical protein QA634_00420 [Methylobacterium nodulans]